MTAARVLAIDPGKGATGIAVFAQGAGVFGAGELVQVELLKKDPWTDNPNVLYRLCVCDGLPTHIVSESQQVYRGVRSSNPTSLITLAHQAGGWVTLFAHMLRKYHPVHVHFVLPRAWKGSVPKEIHQQRILTELTRAERRLIDGAPIPKGKLHNIIDAVGIGKWAQKNIKEET